MPSSRHCLAALLCCGLLAAPAAADALWPRPRNVSLTGACVSIDASAFLFTAVGFDSATLETAFERYTAVLGALRPSVAPAPCAAPVGALPALLVNVTTPDETLSLATDESYELDVPAAAPAGATLTARSVYGALRGLETFAQLADWRADLRATVVAVGAVADAPAFAHRGALIDTSRHFLPLPSLLAMVDALGQNKFNVLHWHIVDSQSFPFVSRAFPALSERGAWGAGDAALVAAHTYKPADVQAVIARGRSWGIRVVPEFDTPGHSLVWGQGQPGLLTACYNATTGLPDGTYGPIDPTVETTWTFLTALFAEVADVFPDAYVHIGGDEVDFTCWASNPAVNAWMAANGIAKGDYVGLEAYYINRVMGIVKATGRSYVGYEELFDNGCKLDADAVINVSTRDPSWHARPTSPPAPSSLRDVCAGLEVPQHR